MHRYLPTFLALLPGWTTLAAEPEWQPTVAEFVKEQKPGFGGLCGVFVDRASGAIIINISDRGFFSSWDGAKTFKPLAENMPRGRTEWPGCFQRDPTGKTTKIVAALVYGAPICIFKDQILKQMDKASSHIDWCAVDWSDPDHKFVFALKHESGDLLIVSHDGGKSFKEVGKGYGPAWIFDGETAVVAEAKTKDRPRPGILRTTDGGKSFKPCGDYTARALPRWFEGVLYWLVEGALIASSDQGANWKKLGDVKDGLYGPIFGKDRQHLFVLTKAGIMESTDGGAAWTKPIAPPRELKGISTLTWLDYDPKSDSLYLMKMGSDLYKLSRGK